MRRRRALFVAPSSSYRCRNGDLVPTCSPIGAPTAAPASLQRHPRLPFHKPTRHSLRHAVWRAATAQHLVPSHWSHACASGGRAFTMPHAHTLRLRSAALSGSRSPTRRCAIHINAEYSANFRSGGIDAPWAPRATSAGGRMQLPIFLPPLRVFRWMVLPISRFFLLLEPVPRELQGPLFAATATTMHMPL